MKKTVLSFGLAAGLIIILYTAAVFLAYGDFAKISVADLNKIEMLGYLRYLILLLTVIFAVRYYKKQSGIATFKRLFLAGFYTALVVALLVGLMEAVYMLMNPDFMDQYAELTTRSMMESGASAEKIEAYKTEIAQYSWMSNPVNMGLFYFLETAILGTIMALIVAFFSKEKKSRTALA